MNEDSSTWNYDMELKLNDATLMCSFKGHDNILSNKSKLGKQLSWD